MLTLGLLRMGLPRLGLLRFLGLLLTMGSVIYCLITDPIGDGLLLPVLRGVAPTINTPVPLLFEEVHSAWTATQESLRHYDTLMQSATKISGEPVPPCGKTTEILTGLADVVYSAILEHDPLSGNVYSDLKWSDTPSQCAKQNTWMQWPPLFLQQQPVFDSPVRELNAERPIPIQLHLALLKARLNKPFITRRMSSAVSKATRELARHSAQAETAMIVTKLRLTKKTGALMYTQGDTKRADALREEIIRFRTEELPKLTADLNWLLRSTNDLAWKLSQI